jgi:hypothetical protein
MKIELKNVKFLESMSEETNCFTADVFINGKKIAYASNQGHGGPTDYRVYDNKDASLLKEAEAFFLAKPEVEVEVSGYKFMSQPTLEGEIDDLMENFLQAKDNKKRENHFKKGICYGTKNSYQMIFWTGITLEAMLKNEVGRQRIAKVVKDLREKGKTILNTNLTDF